MIYVILILIIIVGYFLVNIHKRTTAIVFFLYFTGIMLLFFSTVMYVTKLASFGSPFAFEYFIYHYLQKMKITLKSISRIQNFSIVIIMLSMYFLASVFRYKKSLLKNIFTLLPMCIFLILNDPDVKFKIMILINSEKSNNFIFNSNYLMFHKIINYIIYLFYLILPLMNFYKAFIKTKLLVKKEHIIVSLCSYICSLFYLVFYILISPIKPFVFGNIDLLNFPSSSLSWNYPLILPLIWLAISIWLVYFFVISKPISINNPSINTVKFNYFSLNESLRMILHSYKNYFFNIEKLGEMAKMMSQTDSKQSLECISSMITISHDALDSTTRQLDMLRQSNIKLQKLDIIESIEVTIQKMQFSPEIKLIKNYKIENAYVLGDSNHLVKAFQNIFDNAIDALSDLPADKQPTIEIMIDGEYDWVWIEIVDNGCGIDKSQLKKVFRPLYSTKQSKYNWGIGLSYTKQILHLHRAVIYVKSEINKYTRFQIFIPRV